MKQMPGLKACTLRSMRSGSHSRCGVNFPLTRPTDSFVRCLSYRAVTHSCPPLLHQRVRQLTRGSTTVRCLSSTSESITPKNFYELFPETLPGGIPPASPFHIQARELRKEFLRLQAQAHPDRHPPEVKKLAEARSALINEAYKTLLDPLLRAQYLLSLKDIKTGEDETGQVEDTDLLMEVLTMREMLEDARNEEQLEELKQKNNSRIEESLALLAEYFRIDNLELAKREAIKMRYWVNMKESLDDWSEDGVSASH